jgi:hypothetical protein
MIPRVKIASNVRMRLATTLAVLALAGCASVPPPVEPRPAPVEWPAVPQGKVTIRAAVIECAAPTEKASLRQLDLDEAFLLAGREARVLALPVAVANLGDTVMFHFFEPAPSEPLAHG